MRGKRCLAAEPVTMQDRRAGVKARLTEAARPLTPGEATLMTRLERAQELARRLPCIYPDAHCELDFSNPLELLVATILSAQCTDKRVNLVTPALFARCRTADEYAEIPQEELEGLVRTAGFFRSKATSIRGAAREIVA